MPNNEVATTSFWDAPVTTLCTNLSRNFDLLTFRRSGTYYVTDDAVKYFDGIPVTALDYLTELPIGELGATPTLVETSSNGDPSGFATFAAINYFMWPYNAAIEEQPYTHINLYQSVSWPTAPRSIRVTGKWGFSATVPAPVYQALLLYAIRMIRKAQQNYLEVGTLLDTGQVMIGMKKDEDLEVLINYYKKSKI